MGKRITIDTLKERISVLKSIPDATINHLDDKPDLLTYTQVGDYLGFREIIKECVEIGILKEDNGLILKQSLIELVKSIPVKPRIRPSPQCPKCKREVPHLIQGLCPRCFYNRDRKFIPRFDVYI